MLSVLIQLVQEHVHVMLVIKVVVLNAVVSSDEKLHFLCSILFTVQMISVIALHIW